MEVLKRCRPDVRQLLSVVKVEITADAANIAKTAIDAVEVAKVFETSGGKRCMIVRVRVRTSTCL